jgi:hypothetical protein
MPAAPADAPLVPAPAAPLTPSLLPQAAKPTAHKDQHNAEEEQANRIRNSATGVLWRRKQETVTQKATRRLDDSSLIDSIAQKHRGGLAFAA